MTLFNINISEVLFISLVSIGFISYFHIAFQFTNNFHIKMSFNLTNYYSSLQMKTNPQKVYVISHGPRASESHYWGLKIGPFIPYPVVSPFPPYS